MLLGGVIVQGSGGHGRAYREAMGVLRASVEGVKTYKFDHPSSNETLVFSFHWDRSHHFIPEILEGIRREYLGKEIRHILLGVHMYWDDNVCRFARVTAQASQFGGMYVKSLSPVVTSFCCRGGCAHVEPRC